MVSRLVRHHRVKLRVPAPASKATATGQMQIFIDDECRLPEISWYAFSISLAYFSLKDL